MARRSETPEPSDSLKITNSTTSKVTQAIAAIASLRAHGSPPAVRAASCGSRHVGDRSGECPAHAPDLVGHRVHDGPQVAFVSHAVTPAESQKHAEIVDLEQIG